jgi:hypothetical protein
LETALIARYRDIYEPFIDVERQWIDFPGILDAWGWSGGERILIQTAADLYNGMGHVSLGELVGTLDDTWFERFVEAMRLRRKQKRHHAPLLQNIALRERQAEPVKPGEMPRL